MLLLPIQHFKFQYSSGCAGVYQNSTFGQAAILPMKYTNAIVLGTVSQHYYAYHYMSRVVRKPVFCICENKEADQLRGNREADQRLCFRYIDSIIPLLPKYEISSL